MITCGKADLKSHNNAIWNGCFAKRNVGFPQFVPDANRAAVEPDKDKIASKELALVVADTLPVQMDQMKEGLSLGQVGQRPFEMGYKTMLALKDMKDGKPAPADPTYTGLDVCTPETADTCIAK